MSQNEKKRKRGNAGTCEVETWCSFVLAMEAGPAAEPEDENKDALLMMSLPDWPSTAVGRWSIMLSMLSSAAHTCQ